MCAYFIIGFKSIFISITGPHTDYDFTWTTSGYKVIPSRMSFIDGMVFLFPFIDQLNFHENIVMQCTLSVSSMIRLGYANMRPVRI